MEFSTDAARRQEPTRHDLKHGTIYEARAEDVYPLLTPGSVSLVHSDGPYAVAKAKWDMMKVSDLAAWYRPHIEAWGRLCAPSASIYHWGTAEGWAAVHPEYLRQGWTFRALVTWDKGIGFLQSNHMDLNAATCWKDVTETCGIYQRESSFATIRAYLEEERLAGCLTFDAVRNIVGCAPGSGLPSHWFTSSQWMLPTKKQYAKLATSGRFQRDWESLKCEYESLRVPFDHPLETTNVWRHAVVNGAERIKGKDGQTLHPCQKPLKFADRIIRASSRPGDLILEPFGGTCRIAVACEQIARYQPADARRYICVEMNADGVDYIGPVIKQIQDNGKQVTLFEGMGR